jgi:hypothetical protein
VSKTHDPIGMANSTPRLAADCVEAMKRYQDLGRDIEVLRDHLRSPHPRPGVAPRIAACLLTAATLEMALTKMLITAMSEQGEQ